MKILYNVFSRVQKSSGSYSVDDAAKLTLFISFPDFVSESYDMHKIFEGYFENTDKILLKKCTSTSSSSEEDCDKWSDDSQGSAGITTMHDNSDTVQLSHPIYEPSLQHPVSPAVSLPVHLTIEKVESNNESGTSFYSSLSVNNLSIFSWFHTNVTRHEAEKLLKDKHDGTFLVRESETTLGEYSLSLCYNGHVHHYRIRTKPKFFINHKKMFNSLPELVNHHSKLSDGLRTSMQYPLPHQLGPSPTHEVTVVDEWELQRSGISLGEKVGSGEYGNVYKATLKNSGEIVAVKIFMVGDMLKLWSIHPISKCLSFRMGRMILRSF